MKINISKRIYHEIKTAPNKSVVLGTFSEACQVATVTELRQPDTLLVNSSRQVLAILGDSQGTHPFCIERDDSLIWKDHAGNVFEPEVYDSDEYFKRTPFNPEIMEHLEKEKVLIIGMGSVGAPMGLELAKSGIGQIIAVDKDILEIHNCMRHVLGAAYIGWPKPIAFKNYLEEHVPTCQCIPVFENLFEGNRERLHRIIEETKPTRILAVTDSLNIQYLCQLAALHYNIPLMAVACDSNAIEGEIFIWEPGQAPTWKPGRPERGCYACMRDPDEITVTRSSSFDYSNDDPDSYGGEPALGTFINRINNIATIIMNAWMLRDCSVKTKLAGILDEYYEGKGLQYIRLGGPYPFNAELQITAKKPWAVEWYRVLKRDSCPFCSNLNGVENILFPKHIDDECFVDWDDYEQLNGDEK